MKSTALRIVLVTCAENGFYNLRRLHERGFSIAAVVTIPPSLAEKHAIAGYVDIRGWCAANGIRAIVLDVYDLQPGDLRGMEIDLIVVNGWNRLLTAEVLALPRLGAIGLHAGHPPIGHGRAPIVWNILYGHPDIEVYAFGLTAAADDGPIMDLRTVEITKYDDARTLYEKVMWAGAAAIESAIEARAAGRAGIPQDNAQAKPYAKRTPADGAIDFSCPVETIHDFVRAQTDPYPGAFTYLNGVRWRIDRAIPFDRFAFRDIARVPGMVVATLPSGPVVMTGTSALWITQAQIGGRRFAYGTWSDAPVAVGGRFVAQSMAKSIV